MPVQTVIGGVKSTRCSSARLGPCEVCALHASEVFSIRIGPHHVFGHADCVQEPDALAKSKAFRRRYHGEGA